MKRRAITTACWNIRSTPARQRGAGAVSYTHLLEEERKEAQRQRLEAEEASRAAKERKDAIDAQADREMEEARRRASELIARTRGQIDAMLNEMEELKKQKNKALTAEQKAKLKSGLRALENEADPVRKKDEEAYVLPRPLKKGDPVLIYDIDKKGTCLLYTSRCV